MDFLENVIFFFPLLIASFFGILFIEKLEKTFKGVEKVLNTILYLFVTVLFLHLYYKYFIPFMQ